jgi:hypothetical protein
MTIALLWAVTGVYYQHYFYPKQTNIFCDLSITKFIFMAIHLPIKGNLKNNNITLGISYRVIHMSSPGKSQQNCCMQN